jgi:lipopolysaccharide assembly protein B
MELDIIWLLLSLPLAFVLGWLASRLDLRQLRIDNRRSPKAYFKGLNYLLNEQQDEAIDAFIEAVQKDPDTSELHFALGNLFRRRGEYDRAVRVHEHLLARGDLSKVDRERAQHAVALDFLKAGLLDRAENALGKLEGTAFEQEARLARLAIYERTRDWPQARHTASQLQEAGAGDFSARRAHYLCEEAESASPPEQYALLQQAIEAAPDSGRARIALAQRQQADGQPGAALETLMAVMQFAPAVTPLIARQLAVLALRCDQVPRVSQALQNFYQPSHSLDALQALVQLQQAESGDSAVRQLRLRHLHNEPSLIVTAELMQAEGAQADIQRALDKAVSPLLRYRCAACGFEASRHFWQCPGCQSWDSYSTRRVEEL